MKGKTSIILRNVETGAQRVYEDENLITNALDKLVAINAAMNYAFNSYLLPFASNALGGIMLFDGPLTEDPDNIYFPSEAHLVGYAGQDTDTVDPFRGSYNTAESGKSFDGFVSVWDFGTSQANGTIRAVARTSAHSGRAPLFHYNGPASASTGNGAPLLDRGWTPIRYEGDYVYMLKGDSENHIMRLARAKIPMLRLGCADFSNVERTLEQLASWSTLLTTYTYYNSQRDMEQGENPQDQEVYADNVLDYEDGHDGYIYCLGYNATRTWCSYEFSVTYFTINYGDGSYDKSETHYIGDVGSFYSTASANSFRFPRRSSAHIHKGTLYRMSEDRKAVYKIPLDIPASYARYAVFGENDDDYIDNLGRTASTNGGLYMETYHYTDTSYEYLTGFFYPDGEFVLPPISYGSHQHSGDASISNKYNASNYTADEALTVWGTYNPETVSRQWQGNYLGTVNNLASAIVKTPSETMKIVYTLTDIDDEDEGGDDEPEVSA